jgi:GTP-binding protein
MFVDETEVLVKAGHGGNGVVSFLREKYKPWCGPAGGDGGRGGSVIFIADRRFGTLLPVQRKRKQIAASGNHGGAKNCTGRSGKDLLIRVPSGTMVFDRESGELLCDLKEPGTRFVAAQGGRGGRGNQHFATATHQTPRRCELGEKGQERWLRLELKLIADVGLVGLPNAGKSTLLRRWSAARPKVADYPFTTKEPHLGVVELGAFEQFVVADLPGLIEGAHSGAGLGDKFLRHVERTSFLLHLVDAAPADGSDPVQNCRLIEKELREYSAELAGRPRLTAANKGDLPDAAENVERLRKELGEDLPVFSALTGEGLPELLRLVAERLRATGKWAEIVERNPAW